MKNFKSVSALMFLAISFTACEKNDLVTSPAPPPAAERQGQVILPNWNLLPNEIRDASGMLEEKFTYDSKNRLASLNLVGEELISFEYSSNGQLQRVNHFDNTSATSNKKLTTYDIMVYNTDPSNKPSGILRYATDVMGNEDAKARPASTFEIIYDNNMRKISETEFTFLGNGTAKGITRAQHYQYDTKGNIISITVFEMGVLKGTIQFSEYDSFRNTLVNLPVLNMLPFQINGVNNATLITNSHLFNSKPKTTTEQIAKHGSTVSKKYTYNDYGFPISETTITDDGYYTVNIKYNSLDQ